MKPLKQFLPIVIFFVGCLGFSQTVEEQKLIEKGKKMQDSMLKTPMYKELMRINDQEEANKKAKKPSEKIIVKPKVNTLNSKPKIDNYSFGSLDVNVMVIPFGMENPIKIGIMSKSGDIQFDIPKELPKISKETEENFINDIAYTLFSVCDNSAAIVSGKGNIKSFDTGALSLWTSDNRYVGLIFTVSDEDLVPWIEDPSYSEPVLGSYFEMIYVASPFQYKGDCIKTQMMDVGDAQIKYAYNLNLKAGFNFIEYTIESVHKTDSNVMASFPDKVSITSVDGIPNCRWIGKYF